MFSSFGEEQCRKCRNGLRPTLCEMLSHSWLVLLCRQPDSALSYAPTFLSSPSLFTRVAQPNVCTDLSHIKHQIHCILTLNSPGLSMVFNNSDKNNIEHPCMLDILNVNIVGALSVRATFVVVFSIYQCHSMNNMKLLQLTTTVSVLLFSVK
jgi:hypothetical protein